MPFDALPTEIPVLEPLLPKERSLINLRKLITILRTTTLAQCKSKLKNDDGEFCGLGLWYHNNNVPMMKTRCGVWGISFTGLFEEQDWSLPKAVFQLVPQWNDAGDSFPVIADKLEAKYAHELSSVNL